MRSCGHDTTSRQLSAQTVGTPGSHAGASGNPDSNPDKMSGYGPAASMWRQIPPNIPPKWRDSGRKKNSPNSPNARLWNGSLHNAHGARTSPRSNASVTRKRDCGTASRRYNSRRRRPISWIQTTACDPECAKAHWPETNASPCFQGDEHNIRTQEIMRRFCRSLSNLFERYIPLVNRWRIFDNYAEPSALVARGTRLEKTVALDKEWKNLNELAQKP